MKVTEGKIGRVFVIRLEEGDLVPRCLEEFAEEKGIEIAQVTMIGGIGGGQVVVGPRKSEERPPEPMLLPIDGAHEIVGLGIIAPGENNKPGLHMHASLGRAGNTITGCVRPGITTWLVGEVIITEILGASVKRILDKESSFALLTPGE